MSLFFGRIPPSQLGTTFTHRGWLIGLIPVYIGAPESSAPLFAERNGVPELWFDLVMSLYLLLGDLASWVNPAFEPSFFFTVSGPLEPQP